MYMYAKENILDEVIQVDSLHFEIEKVSLFLVLQIYARCDT